MASTGQISMALDTWQEHNRAVERPGPTFSVLGVLEVRRGGRPVPVPSGRRRAVLAALLMGAGQPVSTDRLVDAAWGEHAPAHPRAAVHTVVSRLRACLGPGVPLEPASSGYALRVPEEAVDATRFGALCDRAARLPAGAAAQVLDSALALWRGPAYVEFAGRDFARAEAARLEEARAAAVERRAELALDLGAPATAVHLLGALLSADPLREHAAAVLMTALYASGRPADALDRFGQLRVRLADELGIDPSPELQHLQLQILGHDLPSAPPRTPCAPRWLVSESAFVGRDEELAVLFAAVRDHRLVTVTGVGGVGKSRLVAESLPEIAGELGLPVTVVELGGAAGEQADGAIAAALGLRGATDSFRETVLEYLSIGDGLLVLDGGEHLVDRLRRFAEDVLCGCPGIRMVVTSRRRLSAREEQVLPLLPLPVPPAGISDRECAAAAPVRLLADRISRVRPDLPLGQRTWPLLADVCRRVEGLPLAIELAAGRAATLGLQPLRDRLADSLDLLGEDGDLPGLRAVVAWSHALLGPAEQRLLAVVSVFAGDFDLAAAESVAGPVGSAPVAACIGRLVDASLIAVHGAAEEPRYRLLDFVRSFAGERLAECGLGEGARRAHARWVLSLAEAVARPAGWNRSAAIERLERHRTDVLAAVRWALSCGDPVLAGEITGALRMYSHWRPDGELLALVGEVADDGAVRRSCAAARALAAGAVAAVDGGDLDRAERLAAAALPLAIGPDERCQALVMLGVVALYRGQHDRSAACWQEVLRVPGVSADHRVDAHTGLGLLGCFSGDEAAAREHADRACVVAADASAGSRAFAAYTLGERWLLTDREVAVAVLRAAAEQAESARATQVLTVARIALLSALTRLGRRDEALKDLPVLLCELLRAGNWPQLWTALRIGAELLEPVGEAETAALVLAAAQAAVSAPAVTGADVARHRELAERIRHRIGGPAADRAAALAAVLPRARVVERALAAAERHRLTPAG